MASVYAILIENGRMSLYDIKVSLQDAVRAIIESDGFTINEHGMID